MLNIADDEASRAHADWLLATNPEKKQYLYEIWRNLVEAENPYEAVSHEAVSHETARPYCPST